MASSIITCNHSGLADADLLLNYALTVKRSFAELRINARILKTFVLCTRKLHNNASFGSFLAMFEDLLHKQVEEVHAHPPDQWYVDIQIRDFIQISLAGEMEKWYVTMLDSTLQSTSLTTDLQVLEIITCLLENLDDHHFLGRYPQRLDPFEALGEQMIFLKTLIYFVKEGSVEVREDLLAHAESNTFKVAYLLFQYNIAKYKKERWIPMRLQISTLVLEMKPVSPLVYEIYTQALSSLNFSQRSGRG